LTEEKETEEITAEELEKHLRELREANQASFMSLQSQGAQLAPASIVSQRLDALLELLDPKMRLQVEVVFERKMSLLLSEAQQDLTRQQLTLPKPAASGFNQANKLFIPGS